MNKQDKWKSGPCRGAQECWRECREDGPWVVSRHQELLKDYRNRFIAVMGNEVVDSDEDIRELMDRLDERFGEQAAFIHTTYMSDCPLARLL